MNESHNTRTSLSAVDETRPPAAEASPCVSASAASPITAEDIQRAVCAYFDISRDQLLAPCKTRKYARARMIGFWLCAELIPAGQKFIGWKFQRDGSTVRNGLQVMQGCLDRKDRYGDIARKLRRTLKANALPQKGSFTATSFSRHDIESRAA